MTITEDARRVKAGLDVYDRDRRRVGYLNEADTEHGWMQVGVGGLELKYLWIPYQLVKSVDDRELFVTSTKDELHNGCSDPPARKTQVEHVGSSTIAVTTEASGYDGTPVMVKEVDLARVSQLLAVDQRVWTADDVQVGRIKDFDATSGYLVIEKGILSRRHDLLIPVHMVGDVDRNGATVTLVVRDADLTRMQRLEPVSVVIDLPAVPGH